MFLRPRGMRDPAGGAEPPLPRTPRAPPSARTSFHWEDAGGNHTGRPGAHGQGASAVGTQDQALAPDPVTLP